MSNDAEHLLSALQNGNVESALDSLSRCAAQANAPLIAESLMCASENGYMAVVREMIRLNVASVRTATVCGLTALHYAADNAREQTVRALLAMSADPNACANWRQETPLHYAATNGSVAVVEALLRAGAAVGARTRHGSTALHYAVEGKQVDIARALLVAGADANAVEGSADYEMTSTRRRPLDLALRLASPQLTQSLVLCGARFDEQRRPSTSAASDLDLRRTIDLLGATLAYARRVLALYVAFGGRHRGTVKRAMQKVVCYALPLYVTVVDYLPHNASGEAKTSLTALQRRRIAAFLVAPCAQRSGFQDKLEYRQHLLQICIEAEENETFAMEM